MDSPVFKEAEYRVVELADMHPAPYNPRFDLQPGDVKYDNLKKSIVKNGMLQPIVWNPITGNAVGGNQRLKILKDLGVEKAVCAVIRVPLVREMEISVALNKHDNLWDREKLREIMIQFKQEGYDPSRTAFDQYEFEQLSQEMNISVSGFFQEEEKEEKDEKVKHTYKCPHCGEVFEK